MLHLFERLRAEEADCLLLFLPGLCKLRLDHIDRLGERRTVVSIAVSEPARRADAERTQTLLYNHWRALSYVGQERVAASGSRNYRPSFQELKVDVCSGGQEMERCNLYDQMVALQWGVSTGGEADNVRFAYVL